MAWVPFQDDGGRAWEVDQLMLWMLVREYVHARNLYNRSRVNVERRIFGPDITTVEIDWIDFRPTKDRDSQELYHDTSRRLLANGDQGFRELVMMRERARHYSDEFRRKQERAQADTMSSIDRSVRRGEVGETAARAVRDVSAGTLVVGATFLTGGAAVGALGAGSLLNGTATYQNTGNLGAAAINATGTFVVGAVGLAGTAGGGLVHARHALTSGQQTALLLLGVKMDVSFRFAQGLVEGKEIKDALIPALINAGLGALAAGATQRYLSSVFDTSALTISSKLVPLQQLGAAGMVASASAMGTNAYDAVMEEWNQAGQATQAVADVVKVADDDSEYVRSSVLRPA